MNISISIDSFSLIVNFIVTISCGAYIFYSVYLRRVERHPFYYFWIVGFILYAFEILTRAFFIASFLVGVLLISSYFIFVLGLWFLSRRKLFLISYIGVFLATFLLFTFWGAIKLISMEEGKIFASFVIFGGLTLLIFYHRTIFGKIADRFVLGWLLLCITNLILPTEWWVANIFAIFSKIILLTGVMDQEFAILTQKVRKEIESPQPLPPYTGYGKEGKLKLVISSNFSHSKKNDSVNRMVQENVEKGVNNYVFSFQDVPSHTELRKIKWISPDKVKIFLFSTSAQKVKEEFTVLPMGITQIGATLSEVIGKNPNPGEGCTVILMDLSLLIHSFGAYPVYNMLLNKMGALREEGADLFAFFHPDTHSDSSVVSLFTNIADEIIKL